MPAVTAIYNEIDPFAAQWMRNLITVGDIAHGVVDERSISDLSPDDVAGVGQRHFFAGIGGWSYALRLAGIPDDADIWTGSCPCQPFSAASRGRGGGFDSDKHLWPTWLRLIAERKPSTILGEQVATGDGAAWLSAVAADLEAIGYAFGAARVCSSLLGFPRRDRVFFVANSNGNSKRSCSLDDEVARIQAAAALALGRSSDVLGVDADGDGFSARMDIRRGYGNAINPAVTAVFIRAALESA